MAECRKVSFFGYFFALFLASSSSLFAQDPLSWEKSSVPSTPANAKISLIIARPVNSGKSATRDFSWISGFSQKFLYFRLGALNKFQVVDPESLGVRSAIDEGAFGKQDYFSYAKKKNVSSVLFSEYQEKNAGKTLRFSMTLVSVDDKNKKAECSSLCPSDKADEGIDSCISQLLIGLGISPEDYSVKFLKTKIVGTGKCERIADLFSSPGNNSKKSNHKKAAEDLKKCAEGDPQSLFFYYLSAQEYALSDDYENAGLELKDLIFKLGPVYPSLYPLAARYFRLSEKFENGLQMIKLGEGLNLKTDNLVEEKALLLEAMEDWENAEPAYQEVLSMNASNYSALLFLMRNFNRKQQADEALKISDRFQGLYPNNGPGLLERGKALIALKRQNEAQTALTNEAAITPGNVEGWTLLGDIYRTKNDFPMAMQCYEKVLDLTPQDVGVHIKIAQTDMLLNNPRAALEILKKIEKKSYDNPQVQKEMGLAEYRIGDTASAQRDLNRYLQGGEPDCQVLLTMGKIYANQDAYKLSLDMYEKALKVEPDNLSARQGVEWARAKLGNAKAAASEQEALAASSAAVSSSGNGNHAGRTVMKILTGIVCAAGVLGGVYENALVNGDYGEYKGSKNPTRVNDLHTRLQNESLYRNVLYAAGGIAGIGFGVTFVIPSKK